jgi:ribosomal protein S18 acetylase RimI-like enzyme
MITIKSLKKIDFEIIYDAFAKAFADYEVLPLSSDQILQMVTRRGFDSELSFGAFDENELVSFTLNGVGNWNGKRTAYDTGTGTIKEYRGKGLAKKIFQDSVPVLKENGISQYLLEVLQHNDKAVNLYRNQGFEVIREFEYFTANKKDLKFTGKKLQNDYQIREIGIPDSNLVYDFWDFEPSWQNSFDSINRTSQNFKAIGAFNDTKLVGYGISELNSGDITQLAVHIEYRRKGVGTILLKQLIDIILGESIKIINTEKDCTSIKSFLKSINIKPAGSQFEMIKFF